jgi:cysteinyl-tRNA synthetase
MKNITLYNSISKKPQPLTPLIAGKVGMYVCGPTVYNAPHVGNARSVVVYDLLYRLLCHIYKQENITYVRNITDVDDKINAAAKEAGITIQQLTSEVTAIFHKDMQALNCLTPTIEPRATEHIDDMIAIITKLIERGNAYINNNHVYFAVQTDKQYGILASRELEEMIMGARIEVSQAKRYPGDFVLWKPAGEDDDQSSVFDSPWGKGRPGWHIECSAMSMKYLGSDFDIHGGGADLMFPHHTNEMAQSCCANPGSKFAQMWVHNGFVTVNGSKMSKSLGNFITVRELLEKSIKGEVIRYTLLATHYRKPLDFNDKSLEDAEKALDSFYRALDKCGLNQSEQGSINESLIDALCEDLNISAALSILHDLVKRINKSEDQLELQDLGKKLLGSARLIGLLSDLPVDWLGNSEIDPAITNMIEERTIAKQNKDWATADSIRIKLQNMGIVLEDKPGGTTTWRKIS